MNNRRDRWIVLLAASLVFFGCMFSPPHLMDDVDATQAQIARNMINSGDWVTAHLDGVRYMEKSPLKYWAIALTYKVVGVHDWAARFPIALSAVLLCWLTACFGQWAFAGRAGLYAGLTLSTCVGLFLFTRFLIPDVMLTLTITLAMWAFLRALDEEEPRPRKWALVMAGAIGAGLLIKGLIAALFPVAGALLFLAFSGLWRKRETWRRLNLFWGVGLALIIAAPWHVLATLRNPPHFYWSLHAGPGQYHGFFWFYFFNEHLLRFLNLRYPRDYNTVPRPLFWGFHLLWLFPWSAFLPAAAKLSYRPVGRAGRARLLALCWTGFLLLFFTFSSTQEYYSMPCYPALALLLGSAMTVDDAWTLWGRRAVMAISLLAGAAVFTIFSLSHGLPAPGDIAHALNEHPAKEYTLSMGHMGDLTLRAFAYLQLPLVLAGVAFLTGAAGLALLRNPVHAYFAMAAMMVLFIHAARLAMVTFDPYLSSQPLAAALNASPPGQLIVDDSYYTFSSVFFYSNRDALLLNGNVNNLEYGSNAPDCPPVFIDDRGFSRKWSEPARYYVTAEKPGAGRLRSLVGDGALHLVKESGGKFLFTNHALGN
jgi:4-amino-4-deoxy-L-arabinose transferase-like glycosyltransferase